MSNYTYNVDYDFGNLSLGGTNGTLLTTGGFNGTNWTTSTGTYSISASSSPVIMNQGGKIECTGENADLVLNGKSIKKTLEAIEERLAILQPNPDLEDEWEELKELGDRYRTLEADIKEKMRVWDILKHDDGNT